LHPCGLIDFALPQSADARRLRLSFGTPLQRLVAHTPAEVAPLLCAVQAAAEAGAWCVGHLRYEAAPAFDPALRVHPADGPLAWFGVFDEAQPWPEHLPPEDAVVLGLEGGSRERFDADMEHILAAIARGDLYQVNHTACLQGQLDGDPMALFRALHRAQPGGYAAFLDTGDEQVLSVSPELFFDWRDGHLLTRPMKGTAPRGLTPAQDAQNAQRLRASAKERSENVMIVDLLRNDVSRLAEPHSVRVPSLFDVQALPTVWQMTSDVVARTRAGTTLADVFAALFPCGSVTGAPKVQAMRLSHERERGPRGNYCGAVGVVAPGGQATFNVAIRTATVCGTQVSWGVGSGITVDATADGEWREWEHKRAVIERAREPFELLETFALEDGVLRHLSDHLERLSRTAAHFGFAWDEHALRAELLSLQAHHPEGLWRIRLLLAASGRAQIQAHAMVASNLPLRLVLAARPFDKADSEFTRFKTTRRAHYDAWAPTLPGVFDTVLWNPRGELTECTRGNLALRLDGRWLTPAASCGLLPGVARARALREGWLHEAVLQHDDVWRASELRFGNSLRGWLPATVVRL